MPRRQPVTGDDLLRARVRLGAERSMPDFHDSRSAVRRQLDATLDELGTEELMVLTLLARRLLEGQATYGHLDLEHDVRDLEAERGDELADALVYTAMAELKRILAQPKGGS
jgi:hypothetical protein